MLQKREKSRKKRREEVCKKGDNRERSRKIVEKEEKGREMRKRRELKSKSK
jgi:hypothetical protein